MRTIGGVALGIAALAGVVLAQGASTPDFQVPAIREPHHFVKLDNKYVRVLDVTVEPFSGTLYHIHENPSGFPSVRRRCAGDPRRQRDRQHRAGGRRKIRCWQTALTHRVGNIGSKLFRNITVQIQARDDVSPAGAFLASPTPTGYQAKPAFENELVRVERLILEPGQSTGRYTLPQWAS